MGFVSNLFGGGGGSGSGVGSGGSSLTNNAEIGGLQNIAGAQVQLNDTLQNQGSTIAGQGGSIFGPAYGQYTGGIAGTLTPAQQALVTQNLSQMDTGTSDAYANLGLGGSTMEGQDLAGNQLKSLAEQSNINFQNESLGLTGLQAADQYYGTSNQAFGDANSALSGASTSLNDAGNAAIQNQTALNNAISSLGNKSSSGLGGGLSNIIGGATGTSGTGGAIASLFGGGAAPAGNALLDVTGGSGAFDLGAGAATGAIGGDAALGAAAAGGADAAAGGTIADLLPLLAFA